MRLQRRKSAHRKPLWLSLRRGPGAAKVRAMNRWVGAATLLALVICVQGCGKGGKDKGADAAASAQGLLAAAQTGDAQRFEAHLDRPAIRSDLRAQLQAVARASGLDVAGGASDSVLNRMIAPEAFHLVRSQDGGQMTTPPTAAQIAPLIKPLADDRACLHELAAPQRCLLTFARRDTGWRLVAMPAAGLVISVPPEPAGK